jgi:hypothetical protein
VLPGGSRAVGKYELCIQIKQGIMCCNAYRGVALQVDGGQRVLNRRQGRCDVIAQVGDGCVGDAVDMAQTCALLIQGLDLVQQKHTVLHESPPIKH